MRNTLKYLGLILLFTIIGFLIRDYFFDLSLSQIANKNIEVVSRNLSGQFYSHITFALSIGIIPILYLITKKVTKLSFVKQGLIACGIIIGTVLSILIFKNRFKTVTE